MIRELLGELYTSYRLFLGNGTVLTLFAVSVAVLAVSDIALHKRPVILSVLGTIGCAVAAVIDKITGSKESSAVQRILCVIFSSAVCVLAIVSSGENVLSSDMNAVAENELHIPSQLVEAMDAVLDDSDAPSVLTMPGWGLYFDAYSSAFTLMFDESEEDISGTNEYVRNAYNELKKNHPDMKKVADSSHACGCEYVVLSSDLWPEVPITRYGYELFYETGPYVVYKEVKAP